MQILFIQLSDDDKSQFKKIDLYDCFFCRRSHICFHSFEFTPFLRLVREKCSLQMDICRPVHRLFRYSTAVVSNDIIVS